MRITNTMGIDLPLAVWLAHDDYDYVEGVENYVSATRLMKPIRHIILPRRIPAGLQAEDVSEMVARRLGHAIHDSIEKSWKIGHRRALTLLGYPQDVIERIAINPTPEERRASNHMIPVYLEQRAMKTITVRGITYTVGGKFDFCAEGILNDFKSTSVYAWIMGSRDDEHRLQGSIYKWLHPDKITEDYIRIHYVFTDWQKRDKKQKGDAYPNRIEHKDVPLMTTQEVENWIINKIMLIEKYKNSPEDQIPECTDEELWRSAPQHRYYADPAKAADPNARSTRNFDDLSEARRFQSEKGGKGTIVTKPGEVKRCDYCAAYEACSQKNRYFND